MEMKKLVPLPGSKEQVRARAGSARRRPPSSLAALPAWSARPPGSQIARSTASQWDRLPPCRPS